MSSFFIRPKFDKNAPQKTNPGKKSGKKLNKKSTGKVHGSKPNKAQKRKFDRPRPADDDEITSDEETLNESKRVGDVETDEDELITPQEKKLKLAKQYLEEIEEEEKRKADGEVEDDIILGRLREDVLKREGKFRKKVADTLITSFNETDFTVLKCKEQKLAITCLVVSSDDKLFAGSKDCVVVKWCLSSMRKLGIIPPRHKDKSNENLPAGSVLCLAVSQDNRYLAVGDTGSHIQIWDPKTLVHIFTFKGHRAAVTGLSFCRINQHLYSASKDKTVKVWSLPERAYVETLFGHQEPISGLDVLAKNRVLTSGGDDTSVRIWKIEEESQLIFNGHKKSIDAVKRLSDVHFVTCGIDGLVCVWANNKKKPLHRIQDAHGVSTSGEPNWIVSIACLPNSEVFASGSSDGAVKLWRCADNFRSATILATIPVKGFVNAMSFTADQTRLVVGVGQEHRLGRWSRLKEAKNSLVVVQIAKPESGADEDKVQNGCNDSDDASTDS